MTTFERIDRPARTSPISEYLDALLERFGELRSGSVASYIPELATADPDRFGICLVTLEGAVYEAGDTREPFTIQSMSKPLTYGYVLEQLGADAVHRRVGVEPSGDPFNEISLHPTTGAPINPMINAGAIACAGLAASVADEPEPALLEAYGRYAGRRLELDEAVYRSERDTGHRNRAIAHLLSSFDLLDVPPEDAVDLYFRQCSVAIDCRDLALVAATLANGGTNPVTQEQAVAEPVVRGILSVMATCGMYDAAGNWLLSVGLPAKSGVSGGLFAVLPGRLGIAVYSPALDEQGNSVRGVAVCRALSQDLALHLVRPGERPPSPIRAQHDLAAYGSKRVRTTAERSAIAGAAAQTTVIELQGELDFMTAEAISRRLFDEASEPRLAAIDLRRVTRADQGGHAVLASLATRLGARGGALAVSSAKPEHARALPDDVLLFDSLDAALEWCEDELLRLLGHPAAPDSVSLHEHELLAGLLPSELELLDRTLGWVEWPAGSLAIREGDPATCLYLVTSGTLSVLHGRRRLATSSAGMTFGELAYFERGVRTADVQADEVVTCRTLAFDALDALARDEPLLYGKLLRRLARVVASSLRIANAELEHLTR
jgi:glutaminase